MSTTLHARNDAYMAGLKLTVRTLAKRITDLEADVVRHMKANDASAAVNAANIATYLRRFLDEFIGPWWYVWAVEDAAGIAKPRDPEVEG